MHGASQQRCKSVNTNQTPPYLCLSSERNFRTQRLHCLILSVIGGGAERPALAAAPPASADCMAKAGSGNATVAGSSSASARGLCSKAPSCRLTNGSTPYTLW